MKQFLWELQTVYFFIIEHVSALPSDTMKGRLSMSSSRSADFLDSPHPNAASAVSPGRCSVSLTLHFPPRSFHFFCILVLALGTYIRLNESNVT